MVSSFTQKLLTSIIEPWLKYLRGKIRILGQMVLISIHTATIIPETVVASLQRAVSQG